MANTQHGNRLRTFRDSSSIVTGAASGFGRALAMELASRGSQVFLGDLKLDAAKTVEEEIVARGGRATAVELDVTKPSTIRDVIQEAIKATGRIDYFVSNAGISRGSWFHLTTPEDWCAMIEVNCKGVLNCCSEAYRTMLEQGFGHIVNVSSIAGLLPGLAAYSATKHAVVGLSVSLRCEARLHGIRVSAICPGAIRSPMLQDALEFGNLAKIPPELARELIERYYRPSDPEPLAARAITQVARDKAIIVVPTAWGVIWRFWRFIPAFNFFIIDKKYRQLIKEVQLKGYAV